ncbi:MAG: ABC transporter ATP-binding protein [Gemmatimonadaceae bacterium]
MMLAAAPQEVAPSAIRAQDIRKTFGPVVANARASLDVALGEIHALVGENGAGKSTLMRMLAGMFVPDAGKVAVNGRDVTGWSTREAIAAGVGMVHQHFMLVPTLTVAENLVLGREIRRGVRLDRAAAERAVVSLGERTGLIVDPSALVGDLSVGQSQRVEILKVLYRGARILILDEPTAVLSPPEVQDFWRVLRRLKGEGGTVVLITHKLDEVTDISDTVTVMRAGETVGRLATRDASPAAIARMMVGRDVVLAADRVALGASSGVPDASPPPIPRASPGASPALSVRDLVVASSRRDHAVDNVSFDVRGGEILGIAGVEGNGQTELVEAIAGLRPALSGRITLGSMELAARTVRQRTDLGLSHIPEDRQQRGLILEYSVADNLILGQQHSFAVRAVLDRRRIAQHAAGRVRDYDIRPPNANAAVRSLSGGNQQKVVIAREMQRAFSVLLAAQPTRGVDVGAIEFIHGELRAARDAGKAVLLVSADLVEVLALSDRVAVMYGGSIVVTLSRGEATAERLGPYMTGAAKGLGAA